MQMETVRLEQKFPFTWVALTVSEVPNDNMKTDEKELSSIWWIYSTLTSLNLKLLSEK